MNKTDYINQHIGTGETIKIVYNGGTQPFTAREICPINYIGKDKINAFCISSGKEKFFFIDKIKILTDAEFEKWEKYEIENNIVDISYGDEAMKLCREGKYLEAVKYYKEKTGESLKEAKEHVDFMMQQNGIKKSNGKGCLIIGLSVLILIIIILI
ncbi:hypothetical protein [Paludibacter sp.]|uniref:hypothetical protein n=1 Tax=Paludibacter sp. TaxID=1898105 RepID=UPI0013549989|nr:hypothetical protein [Paludibacter sp.]MTK53974.1 hypothetical protein [Paludibacter sp.]